ncbi:hypothetical protein H0H92_007739 [Tricholoma furcatifolium]|nr:hypothetical protein H0H92_007739 [Tricholoma furcatifolium]
MFLSTAKTKKRRKSAMAGRRSSWGVDARHTDVRPRVEEVPGVRDVRDILQAHRLIPNTLTTQMATAAFHHLVIAIRHKRDSSFLSSLHKCLNNCIRVVGGPSSLSKEHLNGIVDATMHQLQILADRRRGRATQVQNMNNGGVGVGARVFWDEEEEKMVLMEELEKFVLEDMGKMLTGLDPAHPLLIAVLRVKDLVCCT